MPKTAEEQQAEVLASMTDAIESVTPTDVLEAADAAKGDDPPEDPPPDDDATKAAADEAAAAQKKLDDEAAAAAAAGVGEGDDAAKKKLADDAAAAAAAAAADPAAKKLADDKKAADDAAAATAAAAAAEAGKKKQPDHVNDPIPEEIKGRTRERMEGLVGVAKDLTTKLDTATAELTAHKQDSADFFGAIENAGLDAQGFANTMELVRRMNSTDIVEKRAGLRDLRAAEAKLALQLGETPIGADPLKDHADLLQQVEDGDLKREIAEELAATRNRTKAETKLAAEARDADKRTQADRDAETAVVAELNALSDELRKKDGKALYDRKHAILTPIVKRLRRTVPAADLVPAVREAYNELELPPVAAAAGGGGGGPRVGDQGNGSRVAAGTGNQQPSRARAAAGGGGTKTPATGLEALELGLEQERANRGRG